MLSSGSESIMGSFIFDVTNTTNCKFKMQYYASAATNNIIGNTDETKAGFRCFRLGDT